MKKAQRIFVMVAAGLMLVSVLTVATSPGHRTRQRAARIHARNSIATMSFSVRTNALAGGESQSP
jgi:hypothetical protein